MRMPFVTAMRFSVLAAIFVLSHSYVYASCNTLEINPNEPCRLQTQYHDLYITSSGVIETSSGAPPIRIMLPDDFYIESVDAEQYGSMILIISEISNDDAGSSILAKLNAETIEIEWQHELNTFNSSSPLVTDDAVYIAAIGTVMKVSLGSGEVVWEHRSLYERGTSLFNAFKRPVKEGEIIVFEEKKTPYAKYDEARRIKVDDLTGAILKK